MPTYEYECQKCGKIFEFFQSMSDPVLKKCEDPICGGEVKRLVGAGSGLIFKGSGFYITDYKKSSAPAGEKSESPTAEKPATASGSSEKSSAESSATKTETKSETSTATKTETKSTTPTKE